MPPIRTCINSAHTYFTGLSLLSSLKECKLTIYYIHTLGSSDNVVKVRKSGTGLCYLLHRSREESSWFVGSSE
jgi:hypothetical protein